MSNDLRTRFLNYMTLQRFAQGTKEKYVAAVKGLSDFYNQPPDTLTNDQLQEYFCHLIEDRKLAWGSCNNHFAAISSFYKNVLKWDETKFSIPPRPRIKKLPMIFSEEEVKRLFESTSSLKYRVLFKAIYSAGLRISEAIRLKPEHIESDPSRMMMRIEQGKGKKDRYTLLSKHLLVELRDYWKKYRPETWIFPGWKNKHLAPSSAQTAFYAAKKKLA
jgi:integrase/recombinase XerD